MASLTILFWNVQKKDLGASVARLMTKHGVDLVVLAEMSGTAAYTRQRLAEEFGGAVYYANIVGLPSKTHLFSIHPSAFTRHRFASALGRLNIFEVNIPLFPRFVIGTVHLMSKLSAHDETQEEEARETVSELRRECQTLGSDAFLVCGDFNLNPFDKGMRSANYFHAVMDRGTALRGKRTIQGRDYPMLYNPMWSLLGDYPSGPPGTHCYSPAAHETTHWHMLDQFLLSPELLKVFEISELGILTSDGVDDFLDAGGRIRDNVYSDHLPILLRLKAIA